MLTIRIPINTVWGFLIDQAMSLSIASIRPCSWLKKGVIALYRARIKSTTSPNRALVASSAIKARQGMRLPILQS
jgi:hypothetical protein